MRYQVGPLLVDAAQLAVAEAGRPLPLPPKVVEIIVALCERPGVFIAKDALRARVWPGEAVDDTVLWQKVYLARKALAPALGAGAIETLPRRGYRLTVAVRPADAWRTPPLASPVPSRRSRWYAFAAASGALVAALALAAVGRVGWRNVPAETAPLPPAALQAYNLGRYFLGLRTYDAARKAEAQFVRVVALDPRAAVGYAGLADARTVIASERRGRYALEELRSAEAAARRAVALDPRSAEAQAALGGALFEDGGEGVAARSALARAVALQPTYATGHLWYGEFLLVHRELRAATEQLQAAVDLEPATAIANVWLAQAVYLSGDDAAARRYATRAIGLATSDEVGALRVLGLAAEREGRRADAVAAFHQIARYDARVAAVLTAYVEARSGVRARAAARVASAVRGTSCTCAGLWFEAALTQLALGDRSGAARSLGVVAKSSREQTSVLALDPRVDVLRRDPALRTLLVGALGPIGGERSSNPSA